MQSTGRLSCPGFGSVRKRAGAAAAPLGATEGRPARPSPRCRLCIRGSSHACEGKQQGSSSHSEHRAMVAGFQNRAKLGAACVAQLSFGLRMQERLRVGGGMCQRDRSAQAG